MVYGINGIFAVQVLAINVTGNQIIDFSSTCLNICGYFGLSIAANGELTADVVISITNTSSSSAVSINITGNRLALQKAGGKTIQIGNTETATTARDIIIQGNTIIGVAATTDTYGVLFTGSRPVTNVTISGNIFSYIIYGNFLAEMWT